jgi:hypothetical protein
MPVTDDRVLKEAEILALRAIQDSVKMIHADTSSLREQITDVRERLIRVEMQDTRAAVAAISVRVEALERERYKQEGALGVVGFLVRNWQAIAFLLMGGLMLWKLGGMPLKL